LSAGPARRGFAGLFAVTPALTDPRNLRRLRTTVRSGVRGVTGAPLVFALSVSTMAAGLLLLSAYLLVVQNARAVLASYGEELSLVAFLPVGKEPAGPRVDALAATLRAVEGVSGVAYVSPAEALVRLRLDLGEEAGILEGLAANPLPGSFEIAVASDARLPERVKALAESVRAAGFSDVRYGEAWVESYGRVLSALEWIGVGLGGCLLLVLGVIVSGTVRLAVHARADEIQIQRLVGAGGFLVRLPFYLEAALQGALGAALALGLLYGLFQLGLPLLSDTLQMLLGVTSPSFLSPVDSILLVALGVALGVGSAALSLMRLDEVR
jgi:cell division transport system permease protein